MGNRKGGKAIWKECGGGLRMAETCPTSISGPCDARYRGVQGRPFPHQVGKGRRGIVLIRFAEPAVIIYEQMC